MNILQVCSNYKDDLYVNLFDTLHKININSNVFFYCSRGSKLQQAKGLSYTVRTECYSPWQKYIFHLKEHNVYKSLNDYFADSHFNVVHGHTLFTDGYAAMRYSQDKGIPFVVSVRDVDLNGFFKTRINLRNVGKRILKNASAVIFISPKYREQLLENYLSEELREQIAVKSYVIPNGIDSFYLDNLGSVREDIEIGKRRKIKVLQVGKIISRKNHLRTVLACESLIRDGIQIEYTVVGDPIDSAIVEKLRSKSFVQLVSPMDKSELIKQYRKADVLVLPSKTETFGLVYVEAMSQGLPVIYTAGQGFDGFFENGHVGYSVDCDSAAEIAKAIVDAVSQEKRLSETCIAESQQFNWEYAATEYAKVYRKVSDI